MIIPKITNKLFPPGHSLADSIVRRSAFLQRQELKYIQSFKPEDFVFAPTKMPIVRGKTYNSLAEFDAAMKKAYPTGLIGNAKKAAGELLNSAAAKLSGVFKK